MYCNLSLELRDITHAQYTYTHLFTGRISKLGLHSLQSNVFMDVFALIQGNYLFFFDVSICDIVHGVEAIYDLC